MSNIHPTAIVAKPYKIPASSTVGPYAVLEEDIVVGENVWIDSHVSVKDGSRIGDGCKIYHSAAVAGPPQDLKFGGEKTEFVMGKNCTIREFVTLNRGTIAHGKSEIGDNCLLMAYAHVAHDCIIGSNVIIANDVQMGGHVEIGDWAIIGGSSVIHQFCLIGEHSMIGGGFRATQEVMPYSMVAGYPLRCMGLNSVGLKRRGFSDETISKLKTAYRFLLSKKLKTREALEKIENEAEMIPEVKRLVEFIRASERGVIK